MPSLQDIRDEFADLWGRLGPFWGISRPAARVFAALLSHSDGLDAEQIGEELSLSRGGVSTATRELLDWGIVHAGRVDGTRKTLYQAEQDPEKIVRAVVRARKRREWDPILENVRDWREELKRERSSEAREFRARLGEIEGLIATVDSMADSFFKGGIVSRLGLKALIQSSKRKRTK
jgi:DNA-binding transcriptional regulator GbsR (MarR family)